jgi:hypothetical protein
MRIGTYQRADLVLGTLPSVKLPGEETSLVELDTPGEIKPDIAVRYRQTNVLIFKPNGDVVYNHGGWTTGTTAKRMAGYGRADVEVLYERGQLALRVAGDKYEFGDGVALIVRADGATVEQYEGALA